MFKSRKKNAMENAGGTVITKSIYEGQSSLKWIYRESPSNKNDNGWRAIGDTDTQEYMDDPQNSIVVDFNTLVEIEPAVLKIYELLPAFLFGLLVNVVVSLCTPAPDKEVLEQYDAVKAEK